MPTSSEDTPSSYESSGEEFFGEKRQFRPQRSAGTMRDQGSDSENTSEEGLLSNQEVASKLKLYPIQLRFEHVNYSVRLKKKASFLPWNRKRKGADRTVNQSGGGQKKGNNFTTKKQILFDISGIE